VFLMSDEGLNRGAGSDEVKAGSGNDTLIKK
jgi:hypothetical protein